MTDNWSKDETRALLSSYRKCPALYDTKHKDYLRKNKKHELLLKIKDELIKIKPNVTVVSIKRKMKTLQSQLSKERMKVRESVRSGMAADAVYEPKLWCYQDLQFLIYANDERSGKSNINRTTVSVFF